jgi:hypothetical protein
MVVRNEALETLRGRPAEYDVTLGDGRRKRASLCGRCGTRLWAPSALPGLTILEPGTLDDTAWFAPVAHIWTRSAQRWLALPDGALRFEQQPRGEQVLALVRAWKERPSG